MSRADEIDILYIAARTREAAAGLKALCAFATGRDGFLVHAGAGFRGQDDTSPLIDGSGQRCLGPAKVIPDRAFRALGVEALTVPDTGAHLGLTAQVGSLVWRAGLLVRILDLSHAHLSRRESGGQKTLQHQLVKSTFTESFSLAERVRTEAPHLLDTDTPSEIEALHDALGAATTKAAKLMGGHGYLLGQVNSIEALSLSVGSLVLGAAAQRSDAQAAA